MAFELPNLPYDKNALEPYISAETLEYHHGKHHAGYVKKLNDMIKGTEFEGMSLDDIVMKASGGIFNNAAQHWNHDFYWKCMSPNSGEQPTGDLLMAINDKFGSFDEFKKAFIQAGLGRFGSGWAWLVQDSDDELAVCSTLNAGNPLTEGKKPIFVCDVWEHAYYIDTRNNRGEYLENFWKVANWDFAMENFS